MIRLPCVSAFAATLLIVSACTDSGSSASPAGADPTTGCDGNCADGVGQRLTSGEVEQIIAQGIHEALARDIDATIAVVDRVGNVLGVYRMGERRDRFTVLTTDFTDADGVVDEVKDQTFAISGGLEGIKLPEPNAFGTGRLADSNLDQLAAISKAITGAYLSTEGMAFTSRTASQIVQDHFNPQEDFQPAGPLFGVQFSQLACSDFMQEANAFAPGAPVTAISPGPHHAPLGLAADPGGLPLYKNGTVVGGVGVMADDVYGLDPFVGDTDIDIDEIIAVAAAFEFEAPIDRRASVTVEGKVFRYTDTDVEGGSLASDPNQATPLGSLGAGVGQLIAVRGYTDGQVRDGTRFGLAESGVRADDGTFDAALDAFVFVDETDAPRYSPRMGTDAAVLLGGASPLSAGEVNTILSNALRRANESRAQIRRPFGTPARVTIAVVDTRGEVLGMIRSRDAPMFGADVALQKARTAAFLSSRDAAGYFLTPDLEPSPEGLFVPTDDFPLTTYVQPNTLAGTPSLPTLDITRYVRDLNEFLGMTNALDGSVAFTDRAGGNLSRPFYPDGINGNPPGPLSKPPGEWSVFSTGLQLDVSYNAILQNVLFAAAGLDDNGDIDDDRAFAFPPLTSTGCAGKGLNVLGRPPVREVLDTNVRLANGLQIFPGSVPIYRGSELVGAIGVSGDGVDQDDLISFAGVHDAGVALGGALDNAPPAMRADRLEPQGIRLRYVQCPQAPTIGSTMDNICDGF